MRDIYPGLLRPQDEFHNKAQKRSGVSFKSKRTLFRFRGEESLAGWEARSVVPKESGVMGMDLGGVRPRDFVDLAANGEKGYAVLTANLYSRNARGEMFTNLPRGDGNELDRCLPVSAARCSS